MGMSIEEYKQLVNISNTKVKNPNRQLQGKINHALGENFETIVEEICNYYEINNLAKIEKTPEPMKVLKHIDNGAFKATFTKAAQPDFKGCIKGGRTVVFDAKYTSADRVRYQILSDYQREVLLQYHDLGAISFVLVGFSTGEIYKIGIETWNNMKQIFGRKYILKQELEEKSLIVNKNKNGISDFLELL